MSAPAAEDRRWLDAVARQAGARPGSGPAPIGAIVVTPGPQRVLARAGAPAGEASAVRLALAEAGVAASGATLYVTLAPPAAGPEGDAIHAAGIARLVAGAAPAAGLSSEGPGALLVDSPECRRLHEGTLRVLDQRRPFVTARLAVSADGMAGRRGGGSAGRLGVAAERWNAMQRARVGAVVIGWGTATSDDPELGVDLPGLAGQAPLRVVVAGLKTYRPQMQLLTLPQERPVLIVATPEKKLDTPAGVEIVRVTGSKGRPDLTLALGALAARGIERVYVETGPTLTEALLEARLIDRFHLVQGEAVIGPEGIPATPRGSLQQRLVAAGLSLVDHRVLGADNLRTFERLA